jgi:hypothetical protein
MRNTELREEIVIELEALETTTNELLALHRDVADHEPTVREKTAAAAFLAQFYNGVENILRRISHYHNVPLPAGETWHIELFQRFSSVPHPDLPILFDDTLAADLAPYRRFRHVVFHGYGFQMDWARMSEGIIHVQDTFSRVKVSLTSYLQTIEPTTGEHNDQSS